MTRAHPFLDIDRAGWRLHTLLSLVLHVHLGMLVASALLGRRRLQVRLKVLEKSHLLLQLLWEFVELILSQHVLFLA